jgi:DNA-binding SARP family transcriptional activator
MENQVGGMRTADTRNIVLTLLLRAQRCALTGLPWQSETLLAQAWALAIDHEPKLADRAAWELAWLMMRMKSYLKAAEWFDRVGSPPADNRDFGPIDLPSLVQVCRVAAIRPRDSTAMEPLPPYPPAPVKPEHSAPLPSLWIINLGEFQAIHNGMLLPVCSMRKSLAILRYLLTRHHYAARKEELMELLWPKATPREARHSLHVAVSTLRRYLDFGEGSYLLFEVDSYVINPDAPVSSDSHVFQQLCDEADRGWHAGDLPRARQAYISAIDYYQGDYYVDTYDLDWATTERERLMARYLVALDRLGRISIKLEGFDLAIDCYQRLLERDGFREDAHCQLMRCYQRLGQRGLAIRQYECCAAILANDLALEPAEETRALYEAVLR